MKVNIYKIKPKQKLCWVEVTKTEALQLIRSLVNQLESNNPNGGRKESFCSGDVSEFSIAVTPDDTCEQKPYTGEMSQWV